MLHAVRIRGGQASYSNSYVETSRLQKEKAAGRSLFSKARISSYLGCSLQDSML